MLEALRIHNGQPRFWADDINQLVADFKHNFLDPNFVVSRSAIEMFGQEEAPKAQQQLIGKFGELLRAWPAIRRGAAELRQRGVAVGVTISPAHTGAAR